MSTLQGLFDSRFFSRLAVASVVAAVGFVGMAASRAAAPNLLINPTNNVNNNVTGMIGYRFAASEYLTQEINGLGFVDAGENGLSVSHQVGLYHWDGSAYTLQRSVTIGAGTGYFLNGGYRWSPIATYALTDLTANAYFVGATVTSGDGDAWGGINSADFTSVGNATLNAGYNATAGSFSSSILPSTWNGSFPGNTFYNAPNITTSTVPSGVPEIDPAGFGSVAALLTGALGLIERRRLKAKVA